MRLATALAARSDLQKRLAQAESRAVACARYQEGEAPPEDAAALLGQGEQMISDLAALIRKINLTNSRTPFDAQAGLPVLTDAIAQRDALGALRKFRTAVADAAAGGRRGGLGWMRQMRSELREVTDVPVADLRRAADDAARAHRELDDRIQELNWTTDLIEE